MTPDDVFTLPTIKQRELTDDEQRQLVDAAEAMDAQPEQQAFYRRMREHFGEDVCFNVGDALKRRQTAREMGLSEKNLCELENLGEYIRVKRLHKKASTYTGIEKRFGKAAADYVREFCGEQTIEQLMDELISKEN